MSAFVRISGPPNSTFLVGYPGISATLPRVEGKVEIRPGVGITAPVNVSQVTIALQRRETIHPSADSVTKKHLAASRKELTDLVGKEVLLYRCSPGKEYESFMALDLPFSIFIPYGRGGEEVAKRVPPASIQLPSRTAETYYELIATVQQGSLERRQCTAPVPILRYDTLSSFGMYNRPESAEKVVDHLVTLGVSLPRWSYGPRDSMSVYIKLSPNPDWLAKAKKVTIQKITISIEEEIIYNHEGDDPSHKVKTLLRTTQNVGVKMPESGYFLNVGLTFPAKDMRDSDGLVPHGKQEFPMLAVSGFTTTASLYKIEYYLTVKAHMSSAKDILLRQPIVVCPFDHVSCQQEMEAIERAAKDAANIRPDNPMLPAPRLVRATDPGALHSINVSIVEGMRKPLID